MYLRSRLLTEFLSDEQLQRIVDAAIRIWRHVPLRVQGTDEFLGLLRDLGCDIRGELVHFPAPVIDSVLDRIRTHKQRHTSQQQLDAPQWPGNEIRMFTHGQAMLACDLETNRLRAATTRDLEEWSWIVDSFGDITRSHPTFLPTDAPNTMVDFHAYATIILNSREPHRVSVYNARMLPFFIAASEVVFGSLDEVKRHAQFATKMWVNSPFMLTRENVETAMEARRLLGRPIQPATMPGVGAATPVTLAGALAQNTAEMFALNAVALAVNGELSGNPAGAVVLDMRASAMRSFGPDVLLQRYAQGAVGAYVFGGKPHWPRIGPGAQVPSAQAMFEKAVDASLAVAAGDRTVPVGQLATSDVGSLVQLELDVEMGGMFREMLREVTIDDERLAEALILETAPKGAYYTATEHTAKFFRDEIWLPDLLDFRLASAWKDSPSDMIAKARERARKRRDAAQNQCPLTTEQRQALYALLRDAERAAGDGLTR